jgi:SAM-dependent methyltransferase
VLDLGAGTGRLTRELARRFATVVAVEPDDGMRALIDVGTVLAGAAEAIPLADASMDCVFVGEAFHWFKGPALAEIERVLVPGGGLAIIWTHWWETEPPLPDEAVPFESLREEEFGEELRVDAETLLAMYSTTSSLAALPEDQRRGFFARVRPWLVGSYRLPVKHRLTWTRATSV